jgi:acyl-coenzyme A synthetase/AMP-(fatty) acid ligase
LFRARLLYLLLHYFQFSALTKSKPTHVFLPELLRENLDTVFCITAKARITRRELLAHALALSKKLPDKAYAINFCQNRYLFIVAYLAVLFRNQISLLPPNQSPRTISDLLAGYVDCYCLTDVSEDRSEYAITTATGSAPLKEQDIFLVSNEIIDADNGALPIIDGERTISISFTSGSTGKPKAIEKNWREFQAGAELALKQFNLNGQTATLVSTVPAQHMYGLETSLFWPLLSGLSIHESRPFYPEDINNCLRSLQNPGILVSTPAHLKACTKVESAWPDIEKLLSSTAPMSLSLAQQAEATFNAPLYELFGSTETLSFASRRAVKAQHWQTYAGVCLSAHGDSFVVDGGHLPNPVSLDDRFLLHDERSFSILGRSEDLIKIAGKRASLAELNLILNNIDGIGDGLFVQFKNERLSALVVSELPKKVILAELKKSVDAVFLPRIIHYVAELPRNETGKINKSALTALFQGLSIV